MATSNPSQLQTSFLENRGIIPPPTMISCSRLISFIKGGKAPSGSNESDRIAITRHYQKIWVGKRVAYGHRPLMTGTVQYLLARTRREERDWVKRSNEGTHVPFTARIKWDAGNPCTASLSVLKLLDAEDTS